MLHSARVDILALFPPNFDPATIEQTFQLWCHLEFLNGNPQSYAQKLLQSSLVEVDGYAEMLRDLFDELWLDIVPGLPASWPFLVSCSPGSGTSSMRP
jgi:hypothetical protein